MRQSVLVRVNPNEVGNRRKVREMMEPVSSAIYETLMRQAIANGRGRTRTPQEFDAGERIAHPAIGHRHGGETGPTGMGLEKDAGQGPRQFNREEMRQSRPEGETVGFNYVVHTNHAVPTSTRKTARRRTSAAFLMVVK
jgi:hypothetical protein